MHTHVSRPCHHCHPCDALSLKYAALTLVRCATLTCMRVCVRADVSVCMCVNVCVCARRVRVYARVHVCAPPAMPSFAGSCGADQFCKEPGTCEKQKPCASDEYLRKAIEPGKEVRRHCGLVSSNTRYSTNEEALAACLKNGECIGFGHQILKRRDIWLCKVCGSTGILRPFAVLLPTSMDLQPTTTTTHAHTLRPPTDPPCCITLALLTPIGMQTAGSLSAGAAAVNGRQRVEAIYPSGTSNIWPRYLDAVSPLYWLSRTAHCF